MSIQLIGSIAVTIVILAIAAGITARTGRVRPMVIGLGLAAIPVGLYLTGLLQLTINGITSLVDWFQRTVFTTGVAWGLGLLIGGVVLAIIGLALKKKPPRVREPRQQPTGPEVPQGRGTQSLPGSTATRPAATSAKPSAAPVGKPAQKKGLDAEDAEIEELLRKRGIM